MKNEVHLFHEMQEISINLPIIFLIPTSTEEFSWVKTIRLYIENKYAFGKNWWSCLQAL